MNTTPPPGSILLMHGRGIISALIRWQTWGEFSHAALATSTGTIIEAWQGCGVRERPWPKDPTGIEVFTVHGVAPAQAQGAEAAIRSQLGRPYDYTGVLRFLSRRRGAASESRWFCSELVFWAYLQSGVKLLNLPIWKVSPHALSTAPVLRSWDRLREVEAARARLGL